jgi:hypothetical protein
MTIFSKKSVEPDLDRLFPSPFFLFASYGLKIFEAFDNNIPIGSSGKS